MKQGKKFTTLKGSIVTLIPQPHPNPDRKVDNIIIRIKGLK